MGADRKATIEVIADVNKAVKNFQSLESRFQKLTRQMARDIEKVDFDPTSESAVELRKEIQKTGAELVDFGDQGDKATDDLKRDLTELDNQFDSIGVRSKKAGLNIGKMAAAIAAAAAAAAVFVAIQIGKKLAELAREALKVNVAFESIRASFRAAEDAGADANEEFAFASAVAKELGLELETTTKSYAGFINAALRSNITVEESRSIFLGLSTSARALGLSTDALEGSLVAVQQIASKGRLSLEELSGQLGERMPGALQILAKQLGLTTAELIKLTETGKLTAQEVLPALGKGLQEAFGAAAREQINSYQATMQRLANTLTEMQDQFATGFVDDFVEAINKATGANVDLALAARISGEVVGFLITATGALAGVFDLLDTKTNLANLAISQTILLLTDLASVVVDNVPGLKFLSLAMDNLRKRAKEVSVEAFVALQKDSDALKETLKELGDAWRGAANDILVARVEFGNIAEAEKKAKEELEKLQKGTEDAAVATKKFGGTIDGVNIAQYVKELDKAGKSTKKLADETERSLSLFEEIEERLKKAAQEAAELEKQEAKAGMSQRDLGKSAAELKTEFDALTAQYSLTVEETNRLAEVSFELGSAQDRVADTARDAGEQQIHFGAGSADAAADVGLLAEAATLGSDNIFGLSKSTADAIGRLALFRDETERAKTAEEKLIETVKKLVESLEGLKEATVGGFEDGIKGANEYLKVMTQIVNKFNELKECADEFSKEAA